VSTRPLVAAQPRGIVGKRVAALRRKGILPAVVYGHGHASEAIQLDAHEFDVLRRHVGRNTILDLKVDGGRATPVLVHSVHEDPVRRRPLHVDFFVVRLTEEMTVDVPIALVGSSVIADKHGGTILHLRDTVQVRALPADLPSTVELDISALESFDAVLQARDLVLPERTQLVSDPDEVLVRVQPPRLEEVPVALEAAPAEGAPEAEGEAAPEASETASSSSDGA
jgi:large subunit ribosomal protein L25